ncbi:MAG: hypothetical protein HDS56_00515 [Barnesiella sp.]|nr:hypothetical protein [Bacteroidales bacterium]MBD5249645.1 hypothetical protein [Barnesiella sp.]MBD5252813.1 hypothetical protein [Barnesiella sp.]
MRFTHCIIALALAFGASVMLGSCGSKAQKEESETIAAPEAYSVAAFNAAEFNDGDTVLVDGLCSHLCAHGGTKAFLADADTTVQTPLVLCLATDSIGGAFDAECPGHNITVSGIVRVNSATASEINAAIEKIKAAQEGEEGHCGTEAKAYGTVGQIKARLDEQMAADPADSIVKLGYYIETLSYTLPVE